MIIPQGWAAQTEVASPISHLLLQKKIHPITLHLELPSVVCRTLTQPHKREVPIIYFKDKYFNLQDLSDNGFLHFSLADGTTATPQTLMNYSLNGKAYPLAQSVSADSSSVKSPGVYKIIYAKNNGIIV